MQDAINRSGRRPIVVGGTGLYVQALVDGLDRNALPPGTHVVMRANPNRCSADAASSFRSVAMVQSQPVN